MKFIILFRHNSTASDFECERWFDHWVCW